MGCGAGDLIGARVDADHLVKTGGQLDCQLTVATADINRAVAGRSDPGQEPGQLNRVVGSETGIRLAALGEPVFRDFGFSRHGWALACWVWHSRALPWRPRGVWRSPGARERGRCPPECAVADGRSLSPGPRWPQRRFAIGAGVRSAVSCPRG